MCGNCEYTYAAAAPGTSVVQGNGDKVLPALQAGLRVVSGDNVAMPWVLSTMISLLDAGKVAAAEECQKAYSAIWGAQVRAKFDEIPSVKACFHSTSPGMDGVAISPVCRPPLLTVDDAGLAAIQAAMVELRKAFDAITAAAC